VAISYRQLNSRTLGALLYSRGQTRITRNTSRDRYCCLTSPRITEDTCHVIPTHCCVTSPAHALYSNGPYEDTKGTFPQCCCAAHALERAHRAAAQRCPEQIRHSINIWYTYFFSSVLVSSQKSSLGQEPIFFLPRLRSHSLLMYGPPRTLASFSTVVYLQLSIRYMSTSDFWAKCCFPR
jgi:hypothetical protein